MAVIIVLIIASLVVAIFFLGGFIWAVKTGQFDDTCTPAMRILTDEEKAANPVPDQPAEPNSKPT
jgi:cbb3-type cytochrome oxidase maturation protein